MRAAALVAAVALCAPWLAGCLAELPAETDGTQGIIGGANAPAGKWPDIAAVLIDGQQECSGVLIAPTVALTAGHCNDPSLTTILIGTTSLARPTEGETRKVVQRIEYPDSLQTEDLTILMLEKPSRLEPRAIATGWAAADIRNDARVAIVGYGAIDPDGTQYINDLQEAETTITDADCTQKVGCNGSVAPGGELGAGGLGIDTCPGDSGGPLYLLTSYGTFVAGITSRGYDDAKYACSEGGIYTRPDKIVDWIEQSAGVRVARGPEPRAGTITAIHGDGGETSIKVNDPKSKKHSFAITAPPSHGAAKVRGDGRVRVCTDPEAAPGDDALTVTITDRSNRARQVDVQIPVVIQDGEPSLDCSLDDFDSGCCDGGGGPRGSLLLALGVLLALRRRRAC